MAAPMSESHVVRREAPYLRIEVFGSVAGDALEDVDFVVLEPGSAVVAMEEWCGREVMVGLPTPSSTVEDTVRTMADWVHAQYSSYMASLASKRCGVDLAKMWKDQGVTTGVLISYDVGTGEIVTKVQVPLDQAAVEFLGGGAPAVQHRPFMPYLEIYRHSDTECTLHVAGPDVLQRTCHSLENTVQVTPDPHSWVGVVHTVFFEIQDTVKQLVAQVPTVPALTNLLRGRFGGTLNPDNAGGFDVQCEVAGGLMLIHVPGAYPNAMPTGVIHTHRGERPFTCPPAGSMQETVQMIEGWVRES